MPKKKTNVKKLPVVEEKKLELSEADKYYLIQNRTKDTEEHLADIVKVDTSLVTKFLQEYVASSKTPVSTDSYAIRGGAAAMTPAASMQGDENEREFNRTPEKPRDGVFYTGKKKHLNDQ